MKYVTILSIVFCFLILSTTTGLKAQEIHDAAAAGDLNKVKALLEADPALLESKDERTEGNLKGNTPLISACWGPGSNNWQATVANYLIDKGANVNAKNEIGATPLYFATKDFDLTQRLIDRGANVNIRAFGDYTPLHRVAASGNLKLAKLLLDHGADPNANGSLGTVLQYIIQLSQPNEQMAKLLVENGAKLNQKSNLGNTVLHLAALKGSVDWTRILVKLGADVNAVNDYGHTPLYYAAKHGYRQAADVLIAAGAKENTIAQANYGRAQQLNERLKPDEAYLWYLGGTESPYAGYAVKTKEHLLIFNPPEIDDSPEAGLANGLLNPNELAGQKITALILYPSYQGQSARPSISELGKKLPGINVVLNFKPIADPAGSSDLPSYHLVTPHESFSVDGVQVHTIPAVRQLWFSGEGLGYLVEADGVKIFHAGAHVPGNEASEIEKYRKEIDFLKSFGPIDIAILPVNGRHMWWIDYQSYLYLIDHLSPKAIYLIGDDLAKDEHQKCIEILHSRDIPVAYPEGGTAIGERFHYMRGGTKK